MNYKILVIAILTNFLIILNSWAGCCFNEPTVSRPNLKGKYFPCTTKADASACKEGVANAIAYADNNAFCSENGFTCCVKGKTAFEFHDKGTVVPVKGRKCEPPAGVDKMIELPVDIINFTATFEGDGYVHLDGTALAFGDRGFVEIWRAQIENGEVANPTKIGNPTPSVGDYVEFPFSAIDTNPPTGVSYYVPAELNMDGEYIPHCDYIQTVVTEGGSPDSDLARTLCEQQEILPLLQIFAP